MMSYLLGAALLLAAISCVCYAIYCAALHILIVLKVLGIGLTVLVFPFFYIYWLNSRPNIYKPEPKTLVGKWAQARKQRVCPMIEFTDEDK
jgi:hypothetical protein